jgi:hypothetical protein
MISASFIARMSLSDQTGLDRQCSEKLMHGKLQESARPESDRWHKFDAVLDIEFVKVGLRSRRSMAGVIAIWRRVRHMPSKAMFRSSAKPFRPQTQ